MLPRPAAAGDTVASSSSTPAAWSTRARVPTRWLTRSTGIPHAGTVDRAAYDVTLRWPKKLDLLACGRRVDGGEGADGMRWERRVLDFPAAMLLLRGGQIRLEDGAGRPRPAAAGLRSRCVTRMGKEAREEITKTVADSLAYFEELFGPYPLDELTVVTAPRGFSQAARSGS